MNKRSKGKGKKRENNPDWMGARDRDADSPAHLTGRKSFGLPRCPCCRCSTRRDFLDGGLTPPMPLRIPRKSARGARYPWNSATGARSFVFGFSRSCLSFFSGLDSLPDDDALPPRAFGASAPRGGGGGRGYVVGDRGAGGRERERGGEGDKPDRVASERALVTVYPSRQRGAARRPSEAK
jgi:hypothetical protein